jgi:hypothetical protein
LCIWVQWQTAKWNSWLWHMIPSEILPQLASVLWSVGGGASQFLPGQKLLWFGAVTVENDVILSEMPNVSK